MNKKSIFEIYYLRAFACLAVCLHHFIGRLVDILPDGLARLLYIPASIGTPSFIFISIFLLSTFYFGRELKTNFLRERAKYILLPFISFGIIYATLKFIQDTPKGESANYLHILFDHLALAHWHGYFLLIIFQFIVIFVIQNKMRIQLTKSHVLIAIVISSAYWLALKSELFSLPGYLSWVLVFGWLYVYALGFYCGRLMSEKIKGDTSQPLLTANKSVILPLLMSAMIAISVSAYFGFITLKESKNMWAVLLCVLSIITLFYTRPKPLNAFLRVINKYSFTIYLANPLFIGIFVFIQAKVQLPNVIYIPLLIIGSLILPILLGYLANKTKYGALMFGKTLEIK